LLPARPDCGEFIYEQLPGPGCFHAAEYGRIIITQDGLDLDTHSQASAIRRQVAIFTPPAGRRTKYQIPIVSQPIDDVSAFFFKPQFSDRDRSFPITIYQIAVANTQSKTSGLCPGALL
jgi:hypothetical protein